MVGFLKPEVVFLKGKIALSLSRPFLCIVKHLKRTQKLRLALVTLKMKRSYLYTTSLIIIFLK